MGKQVIVINGKGGSGKDTICDIVSKYYKMINVSSIDPIKEIAAKHGWNGEKDDKSRRFLSDLKAAFTKYNDLPNRFLKGKLAEFITDKDLEIMFVHIREPEAIESFVQRIGSFPGMCVTLLVDRPGLKDYGNSSDDDVGNYAYDYTYNNDKPLEELEEDFMQFFKECLCRKGC